MKNKLIYIFLGVVLTTCASKESGKVLRLAHGLDVNHSVHVGMVHMAEELERLSEGKMTLQIYPSQQLGTERELLELLQIGSIDMSKASAAVVESFSPEFKAFSIPYLFRSDEHMNKILYGDIGERILESSVPFNLRGLSYYDAGKRSFYTKTRRVDGPEDLKGLKIRVQPSNTAIQMVNNYDAAATPIPFGELYSALQQGVVDGAENNPPSFYLTRHYEVCNFYILNEHTAVPDILLISELTWKRLSETERSWLKQAARASQIYQKELWRASEQEALEEVEKAGVEIIRPNKEPFIIAAQPVVDAMLQDSVLKSLYNQIQNLE